MNIMSLRNIWETSIFIELLTVYCCSFIWSCQGPAVQYDHKSVRISHVRDRTDHELSFQGVNLHLFEWSLSIQMKLIARNRVHMTKVASSFNNYLIALNFAFALIRIIMLHVPFRSIVQICVSYKWHILPKTKSFHGYIVYTIQCDILKII